MRVINPDNAEICRQLAGKGYINILSIRKVVEEDGAISIIEEKFEGVTLKERLKKGLDADELEDFMQQLCDALDYLAQHGIFHKEITAENIMIGEDNALKLINLDLAFSGTIDDNLGGSVKQIGELLKSTEYAKKYSEIIRYCKEDYFEDFRDLKSEISKVSRSFFSKNMAIISLVIIFGFLFYRIFGRVISPLLPW
jgi:tRNA A-37 threonylcarbamoyl transferase component Bud32